MDALITGIGVVAPTGIGVAEHWRRSLAGECRITPFPRYPASSGLRVAGQVTGFDERDHLSNRLLVQTDRWTWYALAAGRLALADSGLDPAAHDDPYALAVVTASASGGNEFGQREIQTLWARGPETVSAYQSIAWFYAASTGQISIREALKGPCGVIVTDGAGGLDAVGQAQRLIRSGSAAVLVGGTEAPLSPYALVCQGDLGYSAATDPARAYRPFDAAASGAVPGEGGALLVVEDAVAAAARGARAYAAVLGYAATHDAYDPVRPAPDGVQLARAAALALDRAGLGPSDVDAVFADGAGTPEGDAAEVAALRRLLGDRAATVPVTVPKSMVGRLCSGGGALDVAWAALALRDGVLPPTVNLDPTSAGYELSFVTEPVRPGRLAVALVLARGAGGFNSAVVLGGV